MSVRRGWNDAARMDDVKGVDISVASDGVYKPLPKEKQARK